MIRSLPFSIFCSSLVAAGVASSGFAAEPLEDDIWIQSIADAAPDDSDDWDQPREGESRDQDQGTARSGAVGSGLTTPSRVTAFAEMIENIVITSRKRRESIQDIPISVTALSAQSLEGLGVRRVIDIANAVPNLEYSPTVGFGNAARVNIRGVGQSDPIGTLDPGVGLYVDGVYLPRSQSALFNTSDIERVEVVRGPQGTIFGKNTIGGAVSVVTRRPQFEFGGSAEVRAGNFGLFETRGVVNVPLVKEMAALRLSVATATRDGFDKDRLGGSDQNDDKLLAGRAQLLLLPTENFEILLSGDYSRENKVPDQGKCVVTNNGATAFIQATNALVGYTQACADVAASRNPRRVESDLSFLGDDLTTFGGSAQLTWALGPNTELRSLSSVRGLDDKSFLDFDGTRIELIRPAVQAGGFDQTQISQEFQFSTKMMDDKLNVLAGVFGMREESRDTVFEGVLANITGDDIVIPLDPQTKTAIANMVRGAVVQSSNRVDNLTYAAYTQLSYDFTDKLNATAGLRVTQDRRRLLRRGTALTSGQGIAIPADGSTGGIPLPLQAGDIAFFFERSDRFSDLTPSASVSYEFSPSVLGYVNFSTGFKSGGFNGRAFPPPGSSEADFPISLDPEELTTYEVGFKANFVDQRIAINGSAFYSIYEDIQLSVLPGDPTINSVPVQLVNAGEAIISGGELELTVAPIPNLQIRTAIGVLHDRFTEFDDPSDPRAKDRRVPFLAAYQTSTSVEYSLDVSRLGLLVARADWSTRSRQSFDALNSPSLDSGKRGILDARLSLNLMDGLTEVSFFGRNILDREYLVSGVDFSNTFGSAQRFVGPPRTYGLELRRRF